MRGENRKGKEIYWIVYIVHASYYRALIRQIGKHEMKHLITRLITYILDEPRDQA